MNNETKRQLSAIVIILILCMTVCFVITTVSSCEMTNTKVTADAHRNYNGWEQSTPFEKNEE
jgi:hypothetical protein